MEIIAGREAGRVPVTVFQISGEIGAESSDFLRQEARDAVEAGTRYLLLDLTDVTFVGSAGLRAIHDVFMMLRSASPEVDDSAGVYKGIASGTYQSPHLKLLKPSRRVLQALKLAGFDMFLEAHADLPEAIASF